ncbi:MAG: hypothetical protein R8P61_23500 [Bacteroidia bacterium]|nr:hypothetical protein [Bacteroidia bacterium]
MKNQLLFLLAAFMLFSCQPNKQNAADSTAEEKTEKAENTEGTLLYPEEKHLANVRQLTFGGDNAEAYFSYNDEYLVLQRTHASEGIECDQIFYGKIPTSAEEKFEMNLVSTGTGRTTCAFFLPGDEEIIFASTHKADEACPPTPDSRKIGKYVWPIYSSFELFISDKEGNVKKQLTDNEFYDAEATLSPNGDKVVFTSTRDGDIELYTMDVDGSNVKRITHEPGYDGGAFFSPDGSKLLFRASRFDNDSLLKEYQDLLAQDLVTPSDMELYICDVDGSNMQKITELGNANWAPYFHPSGEKIIFCSNHSGGPRTFNLFMINVDGTGLEQITYDEQFDSFPMFSRDGSKLVFASNRNNGGTRETNVFIADWVE